MKSKVSLMLRHHTMEVCKSRGHGCKVPLICHLRCNDGDQPRSL